MANKTVVINCKECGKTFSLTPEQQEKFLAKGLHIPTRCQVCRDKKRHIEYVPCKDCKVPFPMSLLEMEFYERKGMQQPRRCPECRVKRREAKEAARLLNP